MQNLKNKETILKILDKLSRASWGLGVAGLVLATIGGLIANATVGPYLTAACEAEGKACFKGVVGFLLATTEGFMVTLGALLTSLSIFVSYYDKVEIEKLQQKIEELNDEFETLTYLNTEISDGLDRQIVNTFKVFSLYLKQIADELGLGIEDRISIYTVSDDNFFIIGRFSENQLYTKVGRNYQRRQQGVIETACEKNWAQADLKCAYGSALDKKRKYADEHFRRFRIPAQVANNFRMKSRCYRAIAIRGDGLGHPIAIVCVESTERNRLNHVSRDVLGARLGLLASLIDSLEHHIPSMDTAMSQGL